LPYTFGEIKISKSVYGGHI